MLNDNKSKHVISTRRNWVLHCTCNPSCTGWETENAPNYAAKSTTLCTSCPWNKILRSSCRYFKTWYVHRWKRNCFPVRSIHRRRQNLELFSIPIASKVSAETDTNLKFVYLSVTLNNHTCLFNFSASSCESRSSWPSGIYSQGMTRCGPTLLKTLAV